MRELVPVPVIYVVLPVPVVRNKISPPFAVVSSFRTPEAIADATRANDADDILMPPVEAVVIAMFALFPNVFINISLCVVVVPICIAFLAPNALLGAVFFILITPSAFAVESVISSADVIVIALVVPAVFKVIPPVVAFVFSILIPVADDDPVFNSTNPLVEIIEPLPVVVVIAVAPVVLDIALEPNADVADIVLIPVVVVMVLFAVPDVSVDAPVCVRMPFVPIFVLVIVVVPFVCENRVVGVASCNVIVVPFAVKSPVCVRMPFVPIFVFVIVVVPFVCENRVVGVSSCKVIVVFVRLVAVAV